MKKIKEIKHDYHWTEIDSKDGYRKIFDIFVREATLDELDQVCNKIESIMLKRQNV